MSGDPTEPTVPNKRQASVPIASVPGAQACARKRLRTTEGADVVLVSSDGERFPFRSRLLLASSSIWTTILPRVEPAVGDPTSAAADKARTDVLPEAHLPESAETLEYILQFLEPAPAQSRPLSFPRDWELMKALERYSLWRGIDTMQSAFRQQPLPTAHLAPAFIFSQLFNLDDLATEVAHAAGKRCMSELAAGEEVAEGLMRGVEETGCEMGGVTLLLSWLLQSSAKLASIRARALEALRALDDEYECEHTCTGVTFARLVDALTTTSRKRLRKLDYGEDQVDMQCKDCNVRWEKMVETLLEGVKDLPPCPF